MKGGVISVIVISGLRQIVCTATLHKILLFCQPFSHMYLLQPFVCLLLIVNSLGQELSFTVYSYNAQYNGAPSCFGPVKQWKKPKTKTKQMLLFLINHVINEFS